MPLISSMLEILLEMDHVGTEVRGDETVYTFKTTSLHPRLTEVKAKLLSIADFPMDIPSRVEVEEVKKGILFKEYIVRIHVPREGIGKIRDLIRVRS